MDEVAEAPSTPAAGPAVPLEDEVEVASPEGLTSQGEEGEEGSIINKATTEAEVIGEHHQDGDPSPELLPVSTAVTEGASLAPAQCAAAVSP